MTQIIRLNKRMKGNFSGKEIVTPIGLKPIFSFNANRTGMEAKDSPTLPSDYGDLSYSAVMKEVLGDYESPAISNLQVGFYGSYLNLARKGYKSSVKDAPIYKKNSVAVSIKFRINTIENTPITTLRLVTVGIDGGFLYIHPLQSGKGIAIRSTFGDKSFILINKDIIGELISLVVIFDGENSRFTINGKTIYSCPVDSFNEDSAVASIYLNATDSTARFQELEIFGFDIYSNDKFTDDDVKRLWRNINN